KETIRVDATTTRTVVRTYKWDGNGQRKLALATEEETRTSGSGNAHVVRTTSSSDVNGNIQVARREVVDTAKTSPDTQETETKIELGDGYGGLTPSTQTNEVRQRADDHTVEVKKKTLRPDGNGSWEVSDVTEQTVTQDGKNRTTEERVLHPDVNGRLS